MGPRRLMVTSSKGGIGKSTVSIGLARAFALQGYTVLLVDCDFGNCCLDMLLGLEDDVLFTLNDEEELLANPQKALLHPEGTEGEKIFFCPAPRGGQNNPSMDSLVRELEALENECNPDYVILDTAAGIEIPHGLASSFCDGALVVASQNPVSLRAAENTARALEGKGLPYIRLIINNFEDYSVRSHERIGILGMIDQAAVQIIGIVPRDRSLLLALEEGKMPSLKAQSSIAFANIVSRLLGNSVKLFQGIRGLKSKKLL